MSGCCDTSFRGAQSWVADVEASTPLIADMCITCPWLSPRISKSSKRSRRLSASIVCAFGRIVPMSYHSQSRPQCARQLSTLPLRARGSLSRRLQWHGSVQCKREKYYISQEILVDVVGPRHRLMMWFAHRRQWPFACSAKGLEIDSCGGRVRFPAQDGLMPGLTSFPPPES